MNIFVIWSNDMGPIAAYKTRKAAKEAAKIMTEEEGEDPNDWNVFFNIDEITFEQ